LGDQEGDREGKGRENRSVASKTRRDGLSLIELLVVLAVIGILAAILLSSVQRAREVSRKLQCTNNLMQIGVGISSYVSAHSGMLPKAHRGYSIQVAILPQIHQVGLYNSINFDFTIGADRIRFSRNVTAREARLLVFGCPSDRTFDKQGGISYAANQGDRPDEAEGNGVFESNGQPFILASAVVDGAGNTASVAEWLLGTGNLDRKEPRRTVMSLEISQRTPTAAADLEAACNESSLWRADTGGWKGENWMEGSLKYTLYNHVNAVNLPSCVPNGMLQKGIYTAGSEHGGGANVLFLDGHVWFVRDRISAAVWKGLGTRRGGEEAVPPVFF
jgi:prepilin-type N-terminal cleavage/methylation domain-containing protein/prepilin-type processing-associated H-X9-DG protein